MAKIHIKRSSLIGQVFGLLTVIEQGGGRIYKRYKRRTWVCLCECGETTEVTTTVLIQGDTKSCGCLKQIGYATTHGLSGTPTYNSWINMKARCTNPNHPRYETWGGRGIAICDQWLYSFETFYADMGDKPDGDYSIERKDNNLNYSPENCIWATPEIQNNNQRSNHLLTLNGKTQTIAQWARESSIGYSTLCARAQRGWSDEQILTTPIRQY